MKLLILGEGTLVAPASGDRRPILLPGVEEAIASARAKGCALAIASNQDSVAAGHKNLSDAFDEIEFCMELADIERAILAPSYENEGGEAWFIDYCDGGESGRGIKHLTDTPWRFRKPESGMLKFLMHWVEADPSETLMVGDSTKDKQAAFSANVPFVWASQWRIKN